MICKKNNCNNKRLSKKTGLCRLHHNIRNLEYRNEGLVITDANERDFMSRDRCEICHRKFNDDVVKVMDHNHSTQTYRGALCADCNLGLGRLKDNINNLVRAIKYLIVK